MKLNTKVALVTGGARRIGEAIVRKLHMSGYAVAIHCSKSLTEASLLAKDLNLLRSQSALVIQKELCLPNACVEIIQEVNSWAGRLDLLVNNASLFMADNCPSLEKNDWGTLFEVNVKAPYLLSLSAKPLLLKNKGVIINITDIHAQKPLRGYAVYCQTKAALEMQTMALALELAPEIRVNAVAPGAIVWPEGENSLNVTVKEKIIAKTLLRRHGKPEFIADAVLALSENYFITGQILKVDGGRSLC